MAKKAAKAKIDKAFFDAHLAKQGKSQNDLARFMKADKGAV